MIRTALILAAGLGTRLHPLTLVRAKAAVPLGGVPLVVRVIEYLRRAGVTRVVINLHHKPETVTAHVGHGRALGVDVRYSWERAILGSAGGPRHALPLLEDDPFFLVNADTLTNVDLVGLAQRHFDSGAAVTLAVAESPAPDKYGGVVLSENEDFVEGFARPGERRSSPPAHFLGVQVAAHRAFTDLVDGVPMESIWGHYPTLLAGGARAIAAYKSESSFVDIGTVNDYLAASAQLMVAGSTGFVGRGCRVASSAIVRNSVLWDDVNVGEGAVVDGCVITDGVEIPERAHLSHRLLVRSGGTNGAESIDDRPLPVSWCGP